MRREATWDEFGGNQDVGTTAALGIVGTPRPGFVE